MRKDRIIPYQVLERRTPSHTVFGFMPFWRYPESLDYLEYDLLSHIAVFDFPVAPNGNISYPSGWPWVELINDAHQEGVKVIMTIVNFSGNEIHDLLTNAAAKNTFFTQVKETIQTYNLQGVNVDFENVPVDDRAVLLVDFLSDLTNYLHNADPNLEVSFAAPPINWSGWDFEALANSCDYLFIMGYNFYGPWSSHSGPCAPLTGGSFNMTDVIDIQYGDVSMSNPEKLILGVPYYGNLWKTQSYQAYSVAQEHIAQYAYRSAMAIMGNNPWQWDASSQTSWFAYQDQGDWYQMWVDDAESLGLKYDLAESRGLRGVGIWALGYDDGHSELWEELRSRYVVSSVEEKEQTVLIPTIECYQRDNCLFVNYKNPAPTTYNLSLIDMSGRRCWTLKSSNGFRAGEIIKIDMRDFSNGIYFIEFLPQPFKQIYYIRKKVLFIH